MYEVITRENLVGDRVPFTEIAAVLNLKDLKTVKKLVRDLAIPVIVIKRKPYVSMGRFRAALEMAETSTAPRGRGRPRNTAIPKHEKAA